MLKTCAAVVAAYIAHHRQGAQREMRFYARQRSLAEAIDKAALCKLPSGKRHPHQRRIRAATLAEARRRLAVANYSTIADFEDLHSLVEHTIGLIPGIGPLSIYDISHRIGAHLGYAPTHVYLHSGALTGARALGLAGRRLELSDLPQDFGRLTPAEVEDCLCIYKKDLARLRARPRRA